jgi:hypothetical protein
MYRVKTERPSRGRRVQRSHSDEQHDLSLSVANNANDLSPNQILTMQRTMGNSYVQRVLAENATLTQTQITAAVKYNKSQGYTESQIKKIQEIVGVDADGLIGPNTVRAIAAWQQGRGLDADGKVGPSTYRAMTQPSTPMPEVKAEEQSTSQTPAKEKTVLDTIVEWGQGAAAWSEGMLDSLMGFFEESKSAPANGDTQAPATKPPDELETLMIKPRLSTEEIRRARGLITQISDEKRRGDLFIALQGKVHYHSQRDNESKDKAGKNLGDVMCNLTSLAMVLEYLGVDNPNPSMQYEDALEQIRVNKGLPARTTADGWGGVAKEMGVEHEMLAWTVVKGKDWYMEKVLPELRAGKAIMFSITGHIVRLQNVTEEGLIVDDPYGEVDLQKGEGRKWTKYNSKDGKGDNANAGEDNVWAWDKVSKHSMLWIASFKAK